MVQAGRGRIVLIDDDTAFVTLMHELLATLEGHELAVCTEGERAYALVKQYRPDLVILDIRSGGLDVGWAVLEQLTLDPETRPIPVIVCSAAIDERQDHELLRREGIALLSKPFDLDALLERVDAGLARRQG